MHVRTYLTVALLGLLLAASIGAQNLRAIRITQGLRRPCYVGAPPDDHDRLFVLEQHAGQVRVIKNGVLLPTPFLDVRSDIAISTEQGLVGMTFHPDFETNGYVYINYTRASDNSTMIERWTADPTNPDVADPSSRVVILGPIIRSRGMPNHNAGSMAFGPNDGYLYIALGDGRQPRCTAQNPQTILGKILRIDVDGGTPYAIPPDNPFAMSPPARPEIWTLGWRNPFRFSFDRANGDMYVGDVGWDTFEEINFQSGTSTGGENYGWDILEGTACTALYSPPLCQAVPCSDPSLTAPIYEYGHSGNCHSVIGGYVYRGCAMPEMQGRYFFADWCEAKIWSFVYSGGQVTDLRDHTAELNPTGVFITAFGEDPHGELYFTTFGRGYVFKIASTRPQPGVNLGFGKAGGSGVVPVFEICGRLDAGYRARFSLREAPPNTLGAFLASASQGPVALPFGTIVPAPIQLVIPVLTDPEGKIRFPVRGGVGPATLYAQFALFDPTATGSLSFSNGMQINFP